MIIKIAIDCFPWMIIQSKTPKKWLGVPPPLVWLLTITIYFLVMGIKEATGGFPYIRRCHAEFSIMVFVFHFSPYL